MILGAERVNLSVPGRFLYNWLLRDAQHAILTL